jgi:hypothetical protein
MIQVHLVLVRTPIAQGLEQINLDRPGTYINPARIDTVTPIESDEIRRGDHLPPMVNAVIRYDDPRAGYRLLYVRNTAKDIARARRREILGEDSDTNDWGSSASA